MPVISSGIRLRPASRADIPAIVAISNSSIDEEEDIGFGTPRSELVFSDVERLSAAWQDPNLVREEAVWMAELDGRVVGCVTVEDRGDALEIVNIDVPRELQGRGIGTRMVRLVEERARRKGKRPVTLGTSRNAAGLDWKGILGNGPRDPSALKVPERHPSAPDLRPRGQGQCRLDPSHGKVWVHDIRVQQRIRERARQKDRGSHLGAEWTYGELRTDATAGYSSRQTRRPGRTPEPQFLVAPEKEGEPQGEGQEPGGQRDRTKPIHSCCAPDHCEDGTDAARDERHDSGEAGLPHPFS